MLHLSGQILQATSSTVKLAKDDKHYSTKTREKVYRK